MIEQLDGPTVAQFEITTSDKPITFEPPRNETSPLQSDYYVKEIDREAPFHCERGTAGEERFRKSGEIFASPEPLPRLP